jgi:hypothetical protein
VVSDGLQERRRDGFGDSVGEWCGEGRGDGRWSGWGWPGSSSTHEPVDDVGNHLGKQRWVLADEQDDAHADGEEHNDDPHRNGECNEQVGYVGGRHGLTRSFDDQARLLGGGQAKVNAA